MPADGDRALTYYDPPDITVNDTAIVEAIAAICDECEAMGGGVSAPLSGTRAWS
jgi:hypothetical protein